MILKPSRRDVLKYASYLGGGLLAYRFVSGYSNNMVTKPLVQWDAAKLIADALAGGASLLLAQQAFAEAPQKQVAVVHVKFAYGLNYNCLMKQEDITQKYTTTKPHVIGSGINETTDITNFMPAGFNKYFANMLVNGTLDGKPAAADGSNLIKTTAGASTAPFVAQTDGERALMRDKIFPVSALNLAGDTTHDLVTFRTTDEGDLGFMLRNRNLIKSPLGIATLGEFNKIMDGSKGSGTAGSPLSAYVSNAQQSSKDGYAVRGSTTPLLQLLDAKAGGNFTNVRNELKDSHDLLKQKVQSLSTTLAFSKDSQTAANIGMGRSNDCTLDDVGSFMLAGKLISSGLVTNVSVAQMALDQDGQVTDAASTTTNPSHATAIQNTAIGLHMMILECLKNGIDLVVSLGGNMGRNNDMLDVGGMSEFAFFCGDRFNANSFDLRSFGPDKNDKDKGSTLMGWSAESAAKILNGSGGPLGNAGSPTRELWTLGLAKTVAQLNGVSSSLTADRPYVQILKKAT